MSEEVTFGVIVPEQAAKLLELIRKLDNESDTFLIDSNVDEITVARQIDEIKLINQTKNNLILVASDGDQLIGLVTVRQSNDAIGELGVAVLKDYQGMTIGTNLVEMAIEWASDYSNLTNLFLDVFADNRVAIHIYHKLGFKDCGHSRVVGRDSIHMEIFVK